MFLKWRRWHQHDERWRIWLRKTWPTNWWDCGSKIEINVIINWLNKIWSHLKSNWVTFSNLLLLCQLLKDSPTMRLWKWNQIQNTNNLPTGYKIMELYLIKLNIPPYLKEDWWESQPKKISTNSRQFYLSRIPVS